MAELLKDVSPIRFAISWSGTRHNGMGVFKGWFNEYYKEALESGYAKIPLFWREDLLLSKNGSTIFVIQPQWREYKCTQGLYWL